MRFVDSKRVHQRQRIVEQRVEGIAPRRRIAAAVAALIVAQHAKRIGQRRRLLVPHRQRGGQRI